MPMLRLLHAGLVAAGCQLGAVVIVTLFVYLFFRDATTTPGDTDTFWTTHSPLLIWAYLIIAAGLAFNDCSAVHLTATRIRGASHLMRLARRGDALKMLLVQFAVSAIIFVIFALESPAEPLTEAADYFGYSFAAPIIWGAAMSVGVAAFGASAHATLKAL
jgi:hypothetical protein